MERVKQVVGIDISMDTFDVQLGISDQELLHEFPAGAQFANSLTGFRRLERWARKLTNGSKAPVWFVMEATGVYHEHLAYYLHERGHRVVIVLPTKMKNFVKTLDTKSKTDRLDARAIAQFGLERSLEPWIPPSPQLRTLKILAREYDALVQQTVRIRNQIHAKDHTVTPPPETIARLREQHRLLVRQMKAVQLQMRAIVQEDRDLSGRITNVTSAQGVGFMTAVRVIAETGGFHLIHNAKQLTSYAGYDVVIRQSGKRTGKPAISHKGNSHLRRAVYMPALAAIRSNPQLRRFYLRLLKTKSNKKVALVAVARKLLCLIYALWRTNTPYDPHYVGA
jgi:transposase